jgi:hypothetical protein
VRRAVTLLVSLVLAACSDGPRPDFIVHLVDATGASPFRTACTSGDVEVDVQQGTNAVLTSHGTLNNSALGALSVQIPSYGTLTTIEVTVACSDGSRLVGATPRFLPVGYTSVDVVLGVPSSCALLTMPALSAPREGLALVTLGANVVAIGGLEGVAMPSSRVQVLDPMTLTSNAAALEFSPGLPSGAGLGGFAALGDTNGSDLVIVTDTLRAVFNAAQADEMMRTIAISLHTGAGSESAVIGLEGNGVAVIGGAADGTAQLGISWIDTNGQVTRGSLAHARRQPAAAIVGSSHVLVAGGQAAGEPLFELVPFSATSAAQSMAFDAPTPGEVRYAPVIATDVLHAHAWVGFGETTPEPDGTGTLLATSWVLGDCQHTCTTVTAGPTVAMPRRDVAVVAHHVGMLGTNVDAFETLVIGGDAGSTPRPMRQIDRIAFDAHGAVTIDTFGLLANVGGLSSVGATDIAAGVFLVAGGVDQTGTALRDVEICFPAALEPITAAATM